VISAGLPSAKSTWNAISARSCAAASSPASAAHRLPPSSSRSLIRTSISASIASLLAKCR
jgi:hypothetical protein